MRKPFFLALHEGPKTSDSLRNYLRETPPKDQNKPVQIRAPTPSSVSSEQEQPAQVRAPSWKRPQRRTYLRQGVRIWVGLEPAEFQVTSGIFGNFRGPRNLKRGGGVQTGGFPIWIFVLPFLSFFVLFCPFSGIFVFFCPFLGLSRFLRDFPRLSFPLCRPIITAPTRNSPERVRDTIGTFPEERGNPPVWKLPGLASLQTSGNLSGCRKRGVDFKGVAFVVLAVLDRTLRSFACPARYSTKRQL